MPDKDTIQYTSNTMVITEVFKFVFMHNIRSYAFFKCMVIKTNASIINTTKVPHIACVIWNGVNFDTIIENVSRLKQEIILLFMWPKSNEKILPIKRKASVRESARNITQARLTNVKVIKRLSRAGILLKKPWNALVITEKMPCATPQTMKVQLAPCHTTLMKNTISILRYVRNSPFLLPPNGM